MLSTGDIIDGKYRIVRLLGEGGMGAVYEGDNTRIHRRVAIKILHSNVAEQAEAVQRFEREAQAAGRIGSEHIVEVLDLGTLANGERYLVMEYLEGDSLSARIKVNGHITPAELCPIAYQLLEGLNAAHGAGIIHRDLKPDNVYLLKKGGKADFVKLLDFGISKFNQLSGDSGFSMTRTGAVMGTPYYMAPEQAKGARDMDHRVDLYATGVILYEALTGQVPFNADTFNELLFKIVLEEPRPLEQLVPDIDPGFAAIVNKAMARDPANRFASAMDFQQALSQWAAGYGPQLVAALAINRGPDGTGAHGVQMPGMVSPALGNAAPAMGTMGTGTPGTWSQSGNYVQSGTHELPKKSHAGVIAAVAVVGVLVLGGGGFAAMSMSKSGSAEDAQKQAEIAQKEKQEREATAQRAQDEVGKAKAAQAEAEAAKSEAQADKAKVMAEKDAMSQAAASASAAAAAAPRHALAAAPKRAAPAPAPAPAPVKEQPKSGGSTTTSTGRKIRTSL
ncbi:MAG TPA: serine/threonine-protein kinase [Polyangiaceae bacterium]|jgi:serine/threonine-protein kinase|nr:serine/threonine-protein kinase [Polyangiaceae bacterium]